MCGEPPGLGRQGVRLMCRTRPQVIPPSSSAVFQAELVNDFFAAHILRLDTLKKISDTYIINGSPGAGQTLLEDRRNPNRRPRQ